MNHMPPSNANGRNSCQNPNHNLNTTSTAVGFDTIMTPPSPPHPTRPVKLYTRTGASAGQCKLTQS